MTPQLPQQRLNVPADVDEREFYRVSDDEQTLVTHADLEAAVPNDDKPFLEEVERYWVNKPYAFVVIYRHTGDNEYRYYIVEPRLTEVEETIIEFFRDKLHTSIDYTELDMNATPAERSNVIRDETLELIKRYNLLSSGSERVSTGLVGRLKDALISLVEDQLSRFGSEDSTEETPQSITELRALDEKQVRRILYYIVRDFIRYDKIDPIKKDVQAEDISCNGYNQPVFVYHSSYGEHMVTNVSFDKDRLDSFVKRLAQSAGKGISKREPRIDAALADGSRAQLTLGTETSSKGTNFTIREFTEVPFTPVDLINWKTYSIDQLAYMWLAIEHNKSVIFAGGTASGKTTSLNAMSLFMPGTAKIVSIEDTRELEIPQANWVPRMTRESISGNEENAIDEFDLLEDALRQRPDYVIMGEIRGKEAQTLFQMLNTGHTTYSTFHAARPREVIRRFTEEPINVAESMFEALDIICQQQLHTINGNEVRRAEEIVEVDRYISEGDVDKFAVNDAFEWERETDSFKRQGMSIILEDIKAQNNWSDAEFRAEWNRRRMVLAYMVDKKINTYAGVTAVVQGYMTSPETIMALIADETLRERIVALQQMETVDLDVSAEEEAAMPRPSTPESVSDTAKAILEETQSLLDEYDSIQTGGMPNVEDMLAGDVADANEELIKQLLAADYAGELPGDVDERLTDSDALGGEGEIEEAFNQRLDDLFGDDSGDTEDEVVTSQDLEEINQELDDVSTPTDQDDKLDELFSDDIDEETVEDLSDPLESQDESNREITVDTDEDQSNSEVAENEAND